MAEVPLSRGLVALVDDADLHLVADTKWHAHPTVNKRGGHYAVNGRGGKKPTIHGRRYMHRIIIGAAPDEMVDHINGNGLDNRRANLRIATRQQNNANRRLPQPHGFRGIEPTASGKWRARVTFDRKSRASRPFATAIEAARAYDELARAFHGEFALLNFPIAASPAPIHPANDGEG